MALRANVENIVLGAETDPRWLSLLASEISQQGMGDRFKPLLLDIGLTKEWGYPDLANDAFNFQRGMQFVKAAIIPWNAVCRMGLEPNTILIDGRFRIASFVVSAALSKRPLSIFFDDYVDRPAYHVVEKILKPVNIVGRAACFDISPGLISVDQFLLEFAHYLADPS